MDNQGKKPSQINFSEKFINFGYFGTILIIIGFMLYEWLK
jgi:hypothetical protein